MKVSELDFIGLIRLDAYPTEPIMMARRREYAVSWAGLSLVPTLRARVMVPFLLD